MSARDVLDVLKNIEGFDWDEGNIGKSWKKHKVKDKEAEEIFFNKPLFVSLDNKHSSRLEKRFQTLGKTNQEKKLFIAFTVRKDKIRIISARLQNKKERRRYERQEKEA